MYAWLMNLISRMFGRTASINMEKQMGPVDEDE